MLIKLVGGLIIILTCCCVGYEMSAELTGRVKVLQQLISAFEQMYGLINGAKMPLAEIYRELSAGETAAGRFFGSLDKNAPPSESWRENIKQLRCISREDIKIVTRLADNLGRSGCEVQLKDIRFAINNLESALKEAKETAAKDSRMYKSVSFFAGVGIAVLLI